MRTIGEIIDAVKNGESCSVDELRYTLLAVHSKAQMGTSRFSSLTRKSGKALDLFIKLEIDNDFRGWKNMYSADPLKWLGDDIPENPDYQRRRKMGEKMIQAAINGKLKK